VRHTPATSNASPPRRHEEIDPSPPNVVNVWVSGSAVMAVMFLPRRV
jgi:hypothetical protein